MTTGFRRSDGADLDTLFMAYQSGTPPAATGFRNSSGTDLSNLFQPYTLGSKQGAVGFRNSSGTDLADLFQHIGVPLFSAINGGSYDDARFDSTPPRMDFQTDGNVTKSGGADEGTDWGTPITAGAGSGWEIHVHKDSGTGTIGGNALDTWLSLSTVRGWSMTSAALGQSREANLTVSFRPAGGGAATHAGTISFVSDRT